jgi:transposase InsO family protein
MLVPIVRMMLVDLILIVILLVVELVKEYGFIHITTSPHFPQANGQAERFVQTVKNLIKKSKDPYKALLDYRNTRAPLEGIELSPAQLQIG